MFHLFRKSPERPIPSLEAPTESEATKSEAVPETVPLEETISDTGPAIPEIITPEEYESLRDNGPDNSKAKRLFQRYEFNKFDRVAGEPRGERSWRIERFVQMEVGDKRFSAVKIGNPQTGEFKTLTFQEFFNLNLPVEAEELIGEEKTQAVNEAMIEGESDKREAA